MTSPPGEEDQSSNFDTSKLIVPKNKGPTTRARGKLLLENTPLTMDNSIETFPRTGMLPYKQVKYKQEYLPPESAKQAPSKSDRLKPRPTTRWTSSKPRKAMAINTKGTLILPSAIQAVPIKGLKETTPYHNTMPPLLDKDEKLRAYHARVDLMHAVMCPEQSDFDWQVETITDWKPEEGKQPIFLKVSWFGGDRQWIPMDDAHLHDPFLVIRYVLQHKLIDNPGWEWAKHYMN